jgi:hypothetical protein
VRDDRKGFSPDDVSLLEICHSDRKACFRMLRTIRRSRTRLLATADALALSASAFAATATPAHAFVTVQDVCAGYIYG